MQHLIIAVLCSVAVSVFLKIARQRQIIISQTIAFNYIMALGLCYFYLKPDFKGLGFTDFIAQSENIDLFLILGILLPSVFIFMGKAVEFAGIVRSDAAQRLSLFFPIAAAFLLFGESLSSNKIIGILLAFVALSLLLMKPAEKMQQNSLKGFLALIGVWFGYGVIDILFKQIAKLGGAFPSTLFISFSLAACFIFIYLLLKRTQWTVPSVLGGLVLGALNFLNILFYIKAHQSFSTNPTLVFAGMNLGVICLGTITGALIFKEKISKRNWLGVLCALVAIICLFFGDKFF